MSGYNNLSSKSELSHKGYASKFQVYRNIPQLIPNGINTRVNFDVVQFDLLNEYDEAALYQFTPLQAGYYYLKGGLTFPIMPVGTVFGVNLFVSGAVAWFNYRTSFAGTTGIIDASRIWYLIPTDTVYIEAYQASGVGQNIIAGLDNTFLEGFRIG